jgi:hypothetical protein
VIEPPLRPQDALDQPDHVRVPDAALEERVDLRAVAARIIFSRLYVDYGGCMIVLLIKVNLPGFRTRLNPPSTGSHRSASTASFAAAVGAAAALAAAIGGRVIYTRLILFRCM